MLTEGTRLGVFVDVFNLTDQVYWDRSDMPNPRRWAQIGVEVEFQVTRETTRPEAKREPYAREETDAEDSWANS